MEKTDQSPKDARLDNVILGGGCFWCVEAVYSTLDGVVSQQSGYAGGRTESPSYEDICKGNTGHIEVVQVSFDPARISLDRILDVFFASHDPTSRDRQGNDAGEQYRSVVFYASEEQRVAAEAARDRYERETGQVGRVVTEILPAPRFWPAEPEHDDYFARHPWQGYCQYVIAPKVASTRKKFPELLRSGE